MNKRPYVFIGSSMEGLDAAKAIQANLEHVAETHIWSQGLFGLSGGTLQSLVKVADKFDFAILLLTPDDLTTSRGQENASPRDNVIFELGLFIGAIEQDRVFIIADREAQMKMPSDLAGISYATFVRPISGTMQSALGAACTSVETSIKKLGSRTGNTFRAWWWTGCFGNGVDEDADYFMTVVNSSQEDIPWLNVHVMPGSENQLEPLGEKTDRLMSGQYAFYRFRMLDGNGDLSKSAIHILNGKREETSVAIFKRNSIGGPVLIDSSLGKKLYDRIEFFASLRSKTEKPIHN